MSQEQQHQPVNKPSNLLSAEENQQVYALLGPNCKAIATAVVQLYYTRPPDHSQWFKRDVGIICFVKDNRRKNYFFRMYCLRRNGLIWEQEVYVGMEYNSGCSFLHSFEGDNCIYAFNFACLNEAKEVKQVIDDKLTTKRLLAAEKETLVRNERVKEPVPIVNDTIKNTDRKKNHKKKLTKVDIGIPTGFQHIGKVSWDADKGLDATGTADDLYQEIFRRAGVNKKMLENRSTREFVYEFIDNYSTIKNIAEQTQSPESITVAPTITTPRPSMRTAPPPPPGDNKSSSKPIQQNDQPSLRTNFPPPPPPLPGFPSSAVPTSKIPPGKASPAPPPPPPPPPVELNVPPVNTEPSLTNKNVDVRSALLESIRQGVTLKRVPDESNLSEPSRDHVLKQIKEGVSLKSARAGVNKKMLENRSTREFVYEFIDNYSTIKNIAEQTQSPESITVAPTITTPRPSMRTAPPPPPGDNKSSSKPIQQNDQSSLRTNFPPPPPPLPGFPSSAVPTSKIPPGKASPAPPPPSPPPPVELNVPPVNTEPSLTNKNVDVRSALLESIRQGVTLKRVPDESNLSEPSRDHVLKQIKEGVSLKSARDRELKSPAPVDEVNDIAMA